MQHYIPPRLISMHLSHFIAKLDNFDGRIGKNHFYTRRLKVFTDRKVLVKYYKVVYFCRLAIPQRHLCRSEQFRTSRKRSVRLQQRT